jgi:acetyl-CoA acyltransferase
LSQLQTVFKKDGVIHAGNSSQVSDGAAAVMLASGEKATALGLKRRARIIACTSVGSDPELMLTGTLNNTLEKLLL